MLLLLLLGAGMTTPTTDGVRAYGHTTFRSVTGGVTSATAVTLAGSGNTPLTNAETTEE